MTQMLIALPVENGKLSQHFGRCKEFAFFEGDTATQALKVGEVRTPPAHEPGSIPAWLLGQGVTVVVAGHIGRHAQDLLEAGGCKLLAGAPDLAPEALARLALEGKLETEAVGCCGGGEHAGQHEGGDHGEGGCGCGH